MAEGKMSDARWNMGCDHCVATVEGDGSVHHAPDCLTIKLTALSAENEKLKAVVAKHERHAVELGGKLEELGVEITYLDEIPEKFAALRAKNDDLNSERDTWKRWLVDAEAKRIRLEKQLKSFELAQPLFNKAMDDLRASNKNLLADRAEYARKWNQIAIENHHLRQKPTATEDEVARLEVQVKRLDQELESANSAEIGARAIFKEKLARLEDRLKPYEDGGYVTLEYHKVVLAQYDRTNTELRQKLEATEAEVSELDGEVKKARGDTARWMSIARQADAGATALRVETEKCAAIAKHLDQEITELLRKGE